MCSKSVQANNKWTIGWGATARCDLKCPFCYSKQNRKLSYEQDIDIDVARQFLVRNAQSIKSLNFGTGESFLMPGFSSLLQMCKELIPKVRIAVTTNGAIFDKIGNYESLTQLANTIDELDVSLDFAVPEKHNMLRGTANAWERAVAALELGRKLGMEISIVMVGTPQTLHSSNLIKMISFADHFDATLRINLYMPTTGDFSFSPSFNQIVDCLIDLKKYSSALRTSDPLISLLIHEETLANKVSDLASVRLLPNSLLSPSTYLVSPPWAQEINMSELDLSLVNGMPNIKAWNNITIPDDCNLCTIRDFCKGGSRERRILWYGTTEKRDPYCPKARGWDIQDLISKVRSNASSSENSWHGPTVHLEYLPTIVCRPIKNIETRTNRCAKALLVTDDKKVLLLKKAISMHWELPGGRIKENESPYECLVRELREEIGFQPQLNYEESLKWSTFIENELLFGETYLFNINHIFRPSLSDEHIKYDWVPIKGAFKQLTMELEWQKLYRYVFGNISV